MQLFRDIFDIFRPHKKKPDFSVWVRTGTTIMFQFVQFFHEDLNVILKLSTRPRKFPETIQWNKHILHEARPPHSPSIPIPTMEKILRPCNSEQEIRKCNRYLKDRFLTKSFPRLIDIRLHVVKPGEINTRDLTIDVQYWTMPMKLHRRRKRSILQTRRIFSHCSHVCENPEEDDTVASGRN